MCNGYTAAKIRKAFNVKQGSYHRKISALTFALLPYFCQKFSHMEMKTRNKGLYWLLFFISTAILLFAIFTNWPWLTLIMPFVFTFFVLAMDIV
jgi:hypothetical protein